MYKSKLQEVCQKRKWALPRYTYIKDGEEHRPQFKASVVVTGITFDHPTPSFSSKQALNEAARVAFLHLLHSQAINQRSEEKTNCTEEEEEEEVVQSFKASEDVSKKHYVGEGFKRKLNIYAQSKNLGLPVYESDKYGPCFKARVCIGEDWFHSEGGMYHECVEDAENSAAEAALLSLLADDESHENEARSYKVLLRELTSKEGFFSAVYTSNRHNNKSSPATFSSAVEVNGEVFYGPTAKSRKLAELNAAKTAYIALIDRKLFKPRQAWFDEEDIVLLFRRLRSSTISDRQENPKCGSSSGFNKSIKEESTHGEDSTIVSDFHIYN